MTTEPNSTETTEDVDQMTPEQLAAAASAAGIDMGPGSERPPQGEPAKEPDTSDVPQRPESIPEKFWDAEKGELRVDAFAKSYAELEAKLSGNEPDTEGDSESADGDADGDLESEGRKAVEGMGLDFDAMSQEYAETGALSDETIKKLEEGGIPRAVVDQYVRGVEAEAASIRASIFQAAGGEDNYANIVKWASESDSVSAEDADAFNAAVTGGNPDAARMVIAGMKARFDAENGKEPQRIVGGQKPSGPTDVYESNAQLVADMSSPLYKSDPAFRAKVEAKLARSSIM